MRFLTFLLLNGLLLPVFGKAEDDKPRPGRLVMFIGVDISGSFMNSGHFDNSMKFLATYIYSHLKGIGELETPHSLFVGSIGGARINEAKTFYPIQAFQDKTVGEIEAQLHQIFPRNKKNPFTDYNAFFKQVAHFMQTKKLVMRPVSIVLISDGIPDAPNSEPSRDFRSLNVKVLENLTRNITVRLLYTDPVVAEKWQTKVPRQRVKIWAQDATVMRLWNAENIFEPNRPLNEQRKFFSWIRDNVDFNVRVKRVD